MKHGFLLAALAACGALFGKGPHVPGAYLGNVQVTVVNTSPRPMCALILFQDGGPEENWLGDAGKEQPIAPGDRRVYSLAPGVYHMISGICDNGQVLGSFGTYGADKRRIDGPTVIAMGPRSVPRIAGVKRLWFNKLYTAAPAQESGGGGEEAPAAEEEPAAEASSSSSSSGSSSSSAPSGPSCMAHGAAGCDDSHLCCPGNQCVSRTKYSDGSLGFGYCQ